MVPEFARLLSYTKMARKDIPKRKSACRGPESTELRHGRSEERGVAAVGSRVSGWWPERTVRN